MTDSTTDEKSGEGMVELGPSADELFGDLEDESLEIDEDDRSATETSAEDDGIEDRTATDVFDQLRAEGDATLDTDSVLVDESPEEIIASADEDADEDESDLDDALVDEAALDELLLTGRTKEDEFLWIDSDTEGASSADDHESTTATDSDAETEPAAASTAESDDVEQFTDELADEGATEDELSSETVDEGESTDDLEPEPSVDDVVDDESIEDDASSNLEDEIADTLEDETDDSSADEMAETDSEADEDADADETDDDGPSGFFGWLRAKLGAIF
ncbi:hypothetical protein ACFOZ7_02520 [Natribaculum luteum]|uniref:Uncharacterized protein n=1 Tax=Natribaculum luteum TaxID=1586232 RepID=A0ABD5NVA6_9EURY|nr:hypothetical protein [Natribaculum luteum]